MILALYILSSISLLFAIILFLLGRSINRSWQNPRLLNSSLIVIIDGRQVACTRDKREDLPAFRSRRRQRVGRKRCREKDERVQSVTISLACHFADSKSPSKNRDIRLIARLSQYLTILVFIYLLIIRLNYPRFKFEVHI